MYDQTRRALIEAITDNCVQYGDFTLKSGAKSNFYIDLRKLCMGDPAVLVGHALLETVLEQIWESEESCLPHCYAGVAEGGIPLVSAILDAYRSPYFQALGVGNTRGCWVRKEVKEHGMKDAVVGQWNTGDDTLLLEDVVTSGGSVKESVKKLEDTGLKVRWILSVLNRSGVDNPFEQDLPNVRYLSLVTLADLQLQQQLQAS